MYIHLYALLHETVTLEQSCLSMFSVDHDMIFHTSVLQVQK